MHVRLAPWKKSWGSSCGVPDCTGEIPMGGGVVGGIRNTVKRIRQRDFHTHKKLGCFSGNLEPIKCTNLHMAQVYL